MPNPNAGLLGHAYRWSAALGALCVSGWVALSAAELGHWAAAGGELAHPLGLLRDALARAIAPALSILASMCPSRWVAPSRRVSAVRDGRGAVRMASHPDTKVWLAMGDRSRSRVCRHADCMPARGTERRAIRIDDALWQRFGEVAAALGTDRATLIREWVRWAVGESSASPPRRPETRHD